MLDPQQLALWLVMFSCVVMIYRIGRVSFARNRGWLAVLIFILAISGIGLAAFPERVAYVALALWTVLVVAPAIGLKMATRAILSQRYRRARGLASVARWLHPADGCWEQPELFRALEL